MVMPILSKASFHSSSWPALLLNMMMYLPIPALVMMARLLGENSGSCKNCIKYLFPFSSYYTFPSGQMVESITVFSQFMW